MNCYILSHSTDEYNTKEYMEVLKKYCIEFMPSYTYDYYVFLNNIIDAPKEHYIQFILNQEPYFYITSLSNMMDKTWILLPKLFANKMEK